MISGRCAACKNQRRKCPSNCIFSPYFPANDPQKFACVHKIYGGSNVGRMLQGVPTYLREQAANALYLEAKWRIDDPIYGCVGIISSFYEQIQNAEIELAKIQTQVAFYKLQTQHVEAEPNLEVLQSQSINMEQFESDNPTITSWFN
ncbi:LOB domain-containing protein 23-like [Arachis duranensis]|uniref:LOB domain-containing protein 23-like n=1 Tax=Arachis duranensis TaxID=130453 RepID=A0A6P4DYZ4_ARADU|nr:LOB domain-containing protein 23-like [Arachis duranensis]